MLAIEELLSRFDPQSGDLEGVTATQRHLSDLHGCFADPDAYETALAAGDPLLYTVASVSPGSGPGDLHYAIGRLMPGRVGHEYFLTKGHFHAWREAAEFYFGLSGKGAMLLEDESSGETRLLPLQPYQAVYVPGHTAHRTINTGEKPLIYLGVYPANAGHDYDAVAQRNFCKVLIERDGKPVLLERAEFLQSRE